MQLLRCISVFFIRSFACCLGICAQQCALSQELQPSTSLAIENSSSLQDKANQLTQKFSASVVCIASVAKRIERNASASDELDTNAVRRPPPTSPEFIASRYSTGLVWNDGAIITPYSSLGDPLTHDYFVWNAGYVAHGTLAASQATVLAGEPYTNLAALKILDTKFLDRLKPVTTYPLGTPKRGEICFRIGCWGNYPNDGSATVQWGTITNLRRSASSSKVATTSESVKVEQNSIYAHAGTFETSHDDFGDSSGAVLVNSDGQLLGMGIDRLEANLLLMNGSYALPIDRTFRRVVDKLVVGALPDFGFLGIQPGVVSNNLQRRFLMGVSVEQVIKGMPGETAGLQPGDVITEIGGNVAESRDAIFRELAAYAPGESIPFTVRRPRGNDVLHVDCQVVLDKRHLSTKRPAYSSLPIRNFHGAIIDFATAFPVELLFQYYSRSWHFNPKSLAVVSVDPGTLAWDSGLRLGQQILTVNGKPAGTVDEFYRLAKERSKVELLVRDMQGRDVNIVVNGP